MPHAQHDLTRVTRHSSGKKIARLSNLEFEALGMPPNSTGLQIPDSCGADPDNATRGRTRTASATGRGMENWLGALRLIGRNVRILHRYEKALKRAAAWRGRRTTVGQPQHCYR